MWGTGGSQPTSARSSITKMILPRPSSLTVRHAVPDLPVPVSCLMWGWCGGWLTVAAACRLASRYVHCVHVTLSACRVIVIEQASPTCSKHKRRRGRGSPPRSTRDSGMWEKPTDVLYSLFHVSIFATRQSGNSTVNCLSAEPEG